MSGDAAYLARNPTQVFLLTLLCRTVHEMWRMNLVPVVGVMSSLRHHPPFRLLLTTTTVIIAVAKATNDFGGDFSAGGLSGSTAPGPNQDAMGSKAASAMAIGTGGAGPGNYGGSDFKTPNYTQYTNQDFKG